MAKPDINTTGGLLPATGYDGQISRQAEGTLIDSLVNSSATALTPGQLVSRDPNNPLCLHLASVNDELLGLVVRDPTIYHADSSGNLSFAQYRGVPFLRHGFVKATPAENVRAGDGVVAIFDGGTGAFTGLGGTTNGLSATRRLIRNHKWETNTLANASEPGEVSVLAGNAANYVTY